MLIQVESKCGAAKTNFQKDKEGNKLTDLHGFDQKDKIIQRR